MSKQIIYDRLLKYNKINLNENHIKNRKNKQVLAVNTIDTHNNSTDQTNTSINTTEQDNHVIMNTTKQENHIIINPIKSQTKQTLTNNNKPIRSIKLTADDYLEKIKVLENKIIELENKIVELENNNVVDHTYTTSDIYKTNNITTIDKKILFINFKPDHEKAYGGGNISTHYLQSYLCQDYSNFNVEHTLKPNSKIDIYLMIDPFKDKYHKLHGIDDIVQHRNKYNNTAKILYRVNDCDITRPTINSDKSREKIIIKYAKEIDIFIFNSNFIKEYYFSKYEEIKNKENYVIHNGADTNIFYGNNDNKLLKISNQNKINIVTHHWSNNMFKGYQTYYDLWKYCKESDIFNFIFIGANVPDMFKEVPIIGPLNSKEVGEKLRDCHIYVSDSKYDSCPNHIIEAIMCELPILYTSSEGGGKELCSIEKIGEHFSNFNELIMGLHKICENYDMYKKNIKKVTQYFEINNSIIKYNNILSKTIYKKNIFSKKCEIINSRGVYSVSFNIVSKNMCKVLVEINGINYYVTNGKILITLNAVENFTVNMYDTSNSDDVIDVTVEKFIFSKLGSGEKGKINNGAVLNIAISSDKEYFVGLFTNLTSIIKHSTQKNIGKIMFNYMIPCEDSEIFVNMLNEHMEKLETKLNNTIVYLCKETIPKEVLESKCFKGGNHLLNIGNFARLLIGEIFLYNKLLYLDADSIVQCNLYEKLKDFKFEYDIYGVCANKENIDGNQHMVLKMKNILSVNNIDDSLKNIIGSDVNLEDNIYMGVPFLTNCNKWKDVYEKMINIVNAHNKMKNGLYKLFTMSLFNLIFYKKFGNIETFIKTLADLGSTRKVWSDEFINSSEILDWSGMFKPWFKNGLYKTLWKKYDVLNLSQKYELIEVDGNKKHSTENFKNNLDSSIYLSNVLNFYEISLIPESYLKLPNWRDINSYIHTQIKTGCEIYYTSLFIPVKKYRVAYLENNLNKSGMFNLLCIIDINHVITKMSRVRFWAYESLAKNPNINFIYFGPGWSGWDSSVGLYENIMSLNIKFDFVEWYKPLDYKFDKKLIYPTCIRYNEMWDEEWTTKEINESGSNLIVCHHRNDYEKYQNIFANDGNKQIIYNPHHANPDIFFNSNNRLVKKDIDILLSGAIKSIHYPLRYRVSNLILSHSKSTLKNYKIHLHKHPGYNINEAFANKCQIEYNELLNRSKICITCSSKHNYRLGKYVEITMAGSVICGDLPYEDKVNFSKFVIEINMSMTDEEILNKIDYYLSNPKILNEMSQLGSKWSEQYTSDIYANNLFNSMVEFKKINQKNKKIYVVSEELPSTHVEFKGEKWICDILKDEFMNFYPECTTTNPLEADIIWYLAPWNSRFVPKGKTQIEWINFLKTKIVISTIHHIDKNKIAECEKIINFVDQFTTAYHAICNATYYTLSDLIKTKPIYKEFLWINENNFYDMKTEKEKYREKYNFKNNVYLVGSFQKDTEGKSDLPKLSKGPDIFVDIVSDMKKSGINVEVVLTGLRRTYLTNKLDELDIKYHYFNMTTIQTLNELYCCLDLYLVSSRCEGGPRAIFEAGMTMTPIISTDVGIAKEFMPENSIYDMNNIMTYKNATPNPKKLLENISKLTMKNQMSNILKMLNISNM